MNWFMCIVVQAVIAAALCAGCSTCPTDPLTNDAEAGIVTVDDIAVWTPAATYGSWVYLPDVAYSIPDCPTGSEVLHICGYGTVPSSVRWSFTYGVAWSSGTITYRDKGSSSARIYPCGPGWEVRVSPKIVLAYGSTIDPATEVDWANPTGILVGITGADTSTELSTYGPLYYTIK